MNSKLKLLNNCLFATYGQLRVRRYDGGSVWTFIDGGGANGLNYNSTISAYTPNLISDNNNLYLFWRESNKVRVKQYNGSGWSTDCDGGSGWMHNGTGSYNPFGIKFGNLNYIAWEENVSAIRQIRAISFNGTTKTYIDGDGTYGINQSTAYNANDPVLAVCNGDLYALWTEDKDGTDITYQIRAKKYPLPPIVESVTPPTNATYGTGQAMNFTVNFSKAVNVSGGSPYIPITLNTGGTVNATCVSGTGSKVLVFRYSVVTDNEDNDGVTVGTSITLPGGCTLRSSDATPLDANLTLNSIGGTTSVKVDAKAPIITISSVALNNRYIDVTFNEGVYGAANGITALTASKLSITFTQNGGTATTAVISSVKKNDNTVEGSASALTGGETTVRVFLTITGTPNGLETIEIKPANATSVYDQVGNAVPVTITTGIKNLNDNTPPVILSASRTDDNHLVVTLSKNCVNITKANNGGFAVHQADQTLYTYIISSIAQGSDASHVVLTIEDFGASAKEGVTIKYTAGGNGTILDIMGNAMATNSSGVTVAPWDVVAPTIVSGSIASDNSYIDVTFSEGVYGTSDGVTPLSAASLSLTFTQNGGTATNAVISSVRQNNNTGEGSASPLSGGETTVRVFLLITGNPKGVETIEIRPANGTSVYDKAGNVAVAIQTTGSKTLNDKLSPTMVSAVRTDDTHILITLSENCVNIIKAHDGGFSVYETGNPGTIYSVPSIAQEVDASHVRLTIASMAISAKEGVTVIYTYGGNGSVQDLQGNLMATNSTGIEVAPWDQIAPAITSAILASDNSFIDLNFSEGVYGVANGIAALTASKLALTFTKNAGGNATGAVISSVKKNDNSVEGSASALTGGETTIRVFLSVTGTPSGLETIEVKPFDAASVFDKAGNASSTSVSSGTKALNDKLAPTVSSVSVPSNAWYVAGQNLDFTVNFSEAVAVIGIPYIPITLATGGTVNAAYLSGSGTTALVFRYTLATGNYDNDGVAVGSVITLNGGTIYDAIGNVATLTLNGVGNTTGVLVDAIVPTISSVSSTTANGTYKTGDVIAITITFSEAITVTGTPTLSLNSGESASYASGSGSSVLTFNYTIGSGNSSSDLDYSATNSLSLAGGTIKDAAGNAVTLTLPTVGGASSLGGQKNIVIDGIAPSVSSVGIPSNATYVASQIIDFTVNFSEEVNVVTTGGTPYIPITLATGGTVNASYLSGSGSTALVFRYTVATGNYDNDGISVGSAITLNGGTLKDVAGNNAALTLNGVGTTTGVMVDAIVPTISSVSSSTTNGAYKPGDVIAISITFSEAVAVTGTPTLSLNSGGSASYASGSGTSVLTFNYTVSSGNSSSDLDYSATNSLSLAGGTIKDAAGNAATLTLPTVGGANSLGGQKNIVIDGIAPSVSSVSVPSNATYVASQNLDFTVNFSEVVNMVTTGGTPCITITLSTGGAVNASYLSGTGTTALVFRYSVVTGNYDNDGVTVGSAITLNGGTLKDGAGNNAVLALNGVGITTGVLVDAIVPAISSVSSSMANGAYKIDDVIAITLTFSEAVIVTGTPTLSLNSGGDASYASGSGSSVLTFNYTVSNGNSSFDLDYSATNSLSLSGGDIQDAAGNAATLTLPTVGGASSLGGQKNIVIDGITPLVSSVEVPSNAIYTAGQNLDFTVYFSEVVNVVATGGTPCITITLSTGGTVNASYLSGTGTAALVFRYTILTGNYDNDGISVGSVITLNGGTLKDIIGNNAALTLNGIATTTGVLIDAISPSVSSVSVPANATYVAGQNLDFMVNFSEDVTVVATNGIPSFPITLATGGTVNASYLSGSGTTALIFRYTVKTGDYDNGGLIVSSAITLNGGTLKDAAGNNAALTLNGVGTITGVLVDAIDPTVSSVSSTTVNGTYKIGDVIDVTLTFSEAVTVTGTPAISLNSGGSAYYASGSGSSVLTFNYTIGNGNSSSDFDYSVTNSLSLAGGMLKDAAGNAATLTLPTVGGASSLGGQKNIVIDGIAPSVTLFSTVADPTNTSPIPFTITFSESVTGFDANDISVVNGNKGNLSGSGANYSINITPSGQGTVIVNILAGVTIDIAGNSNTAATQISCTFDNVAPTVALSSTASEPTNVSLIPVTITFSESVIGFDASDITVANGATGTISGSGASYSINITPSGQGALTVNVFAGVAADAAGNSNTEATQLTRTFDNVEPSVTLSSTAPDTTNVSPIPVYITFSESVTGFDVNDLVVTNGTTGDFSGSGSSYTVNITPAGQGLVTINLAAGIAQDAASNMNNAATQLSRRYDNIAPALLSALRIDDNHIKVTLSEDCINLTKANDGGFTVFETGTPSTIYTVSAISLEGDKSHITLTLSNLSTSGTKGITVMYTAGGNGAIQDIAGNIMGSNSTGVLITPWLATITFNSNGGSSVIDQYVAYNGTTTQPSAPTKTGYTFAGWYINAGLTFGFSFATAITADIALYAKWNIYSYAVTFNSNGGSAVSDQAVNYNITAIEPPEPTKIGYTFSGWYSDAGLTSAFNFTNAITENITLYAKWIINTYTVSFNSNGGSAISSQTMNYNTTAAEPTAPIKTGYTFEGWYSDAGLTSVFSFITTITEEITLHAKWTINTYTITFNSNGGSALSDQIVNYNDIAVQPTTPSKTGYFFAGWYSDAGLTSSFSFATTITSNITLFAKWSINGYTVSFNSNGGSNISSQDVSYNTTAAEPVAPTKTGYTFGGWYSDAGLSSAFSFNTAIIADIALYAKWNINTYSVSFNSNGGSAISNQAVSYNVTITEPITPTKTGYTFGGWYNNAGLTSAFNFTTTIIEDITLYAKWTINTYTITFNSNGGSAVNNQTVNYNTTATEPTAPTKTGHTFEGWYSDAGLISAFNFTTDITESITLYAKWNINTYTVTFNSNGGSAISNQAVSYNVTITEPITPTKTGYTFGGWYNNAGLTSVFNFTTTIIEDITLYAKWTINTYTITFNSNGGSAVNNQTVNYNTTATEPTAPTKTGHTFEGWYSDAGFTSAFNFTTNITENITLYAKWNINSYIVAFNGNGGTAISDQTVNFNNTAIQPTAPIKTGFNFEGWYSDTGLTSIFNFNTAITEDITLYAKWTINTYTITFNSNGGSAISDQIVNYDAKAVQPITPSKTGYFFAGWYGDAGMTSSFSFATAITANTSLYAKWTNNGYTVSFNSNGGSSINSQDVSYNTTATEPTAPTNTGYTFGGWYSDAGLTSAFNFTTAISENIMLYAKWNINSYIVAFNSNGGSAIGDQTVNYNATAIQPTTPTKTGNTFEGWFSDAGLTSAFSFNTAIIGDVTLYAKWNINNYTVTFNSNGGSSVNIQTVGYNTTATQPTVPVKTGYAFEGWYSDAGLSSAFTFSNAITSDIILYAKWAINNYTVTFNSNGGSAVNDQTVNYNATAIQPVLPVRSGYSFDGWFSDAGLTSAFNFTTAINEDIILYAKWISAGTISQSISFAPLAEQTYGNDDFEPVATASSALVVNFTSSDKSVASIISNKVHIVGAGTCNIYADQAGDGTYAAAPQVSQSLKINPKALTITGVSASNKVYDGTTTAMLTGGTLNGVISPDVVTLIPGTGAFSDKNAGNVKTVTANGYTIGGTAAVNYTLSAQPSGLTASITKADLKATIAVSPEAATYKGGDMLTFTVTFSPAINVLENAPYINLNGAGINISPELTTTDRSIWTYQWTVPKSGSGTIILGAALQDVLNNYIQSVEGITTIVIDNTDLVQTKTMNFTLVNVYPTLNEGKFNINLESSEYGMVTVKVTNILGSTAKEVSFYKSIKNQTFEVNIEDRVYGTYMVEIIIGNCRNMQRIVIK